MLLNLTLVLSPSPEQLVQSGLVWDLEFQGLKSLLPVVLRPGSASQALTPFRITGIWRSPVVQGTQEVCEV